MLRADSPSLRGEPGFIKAAKRPSAHRTPAWWSTLRWRKAGWRIFWKWRSCGETSRRRMKYSWGWDAQTVHLSKSCFLLTKELPFNPSVEYLFKGRSEVDFSEILSMLFCSFGVRGGIKSNTWHWYLQLKWPRMRLLRLEVTEGPGWSGAMSSTWVLPQLGTISCKREVLEGPLLCCPVLSCVWVCCLFLNFSVSLSTYCAAVLVFFLPVVPVCLLLSPWAQIFLLFWLNKSTPVQSWSCRVFGKVTPVLHRQFSPLTLCPLMINSFTSLFDPVLPAQVIDLPPSTETKYLLPESWMLDCPYVTPSNVMFSKTLQSNWAAHVLLKVWWQKTLV